MTFPANPPPPLNGNDLHWMEQALKLAEQASASGEVPVGALVVHENKMIGQGFNQPIARCDPTAHAEMFALRQAAEKMDNYRLLNTTLYVTLEPCVMCAGALLHARVKRVVFGALDPKMGAVGSRLNALKDVFWDHQIECVSGVLSDRCGEILKEFFQARR